MTGRLLWHGPEDSAARTPDAVAVEAPDGEVRYAALAADSDRLAGWLQANGVGPGTRVALLMPKTRRTVVAMLGVVKCGAAYVPLDPRHPGARLAGILADTAPRAIVTTGTALRVVAAHRDALPPVGAVLVSDADAAPESPEPLAGWAPLAGWDAVAATPSLTERVAGDEDAPAYVLYTSGSTGVPKGVVLSHRNALAFVEWGVETFGVGPEDRLSNHAPLTFDLSVFDVHAALLSGARVCHVPERIEAFPSTLAAWIEERGITVWYSVPSALIRLLVGGAMERFGYEQVRTVLFAGERFPVTHLRTAMERFRHAEFHNLYGPTETNVITSHAVPRPLPDDLTEVPIGRACCGAELVVVDEACRPVPDGEAGELLAVGPTVMLGYHARHELNARVLVPDPRDPATGRRAYRTGDVVRRGTDRVLTLVGRRDNMVKTRGYRVELGEVEHVIERFPGIRQAAVVAVPDELLGARLAAAVVPAADAPALDALEAHCGRHLPRHAVPERFDLLAELPLTANGKCDRAALTARMGQYFSQ